MSTIENLENIDKEKKTLVILSPTVITTVDILIFSSHTHTPHVCVHTHAHTHAWALFQINKIKSNYSPSFLMRSTQKKVVISINTFVNSCSFTMDFLGFIR